jgi:hypothetical protein
MSVCFSILETEGCLIFKVAAISACALHFGIDPIRLTDEARFTDDLALTGLIGSSVDYDRRADFRLRDRGRGR